MVAGKGGVGRTTVAAALAGRAAAAGKRVLAVDAIGSGGLDQLIERVRSEADGADPAASVDTTGFSLDFQTLRLTTRSSLDEYLKIYLRLPLNPSRLGPLATIFDYVSAAAPGVRELLIIGKIGWEVRSGNWDEIIVDAPATGHVVELLTAPRSMAELIPTGPLAQQTDWLTEVLGAASTEIVLVTLPEELPVTETGELLARIRSETETSVSLLVANRTPRQIGPAGMAEAAALGGTTAAVAPVAQLAAARAEAAASQLERLAEHRLPTVYVQERHGAAVTAVVDAVAGMATW
ncbi:MAG: ArsA-related P-loop ATPase [Actinomycetota bacterium]